ncbi:SafA/ExsA family spore coat assembly protein [Robertmurraya massiliosenegalensis]|uniref:SafA/ExsA family spore coat assembly protein n=1 Tax=Robertmurraya massiliosenegalensis TaxID=1287657 RepID=UPI0002ECA635|nr:SafA/ExsA family spore coat assembly protein [Robertmurraya massiliosenegalensis]
MKIHIVQKGDTLWKIAKKYGVNFEELKQLNSQLSNPDMIMPGMKIKVPTAGGSVKKEAPISGQKEAKLNLGVKKEKQIQDHPFVKEKKKEAPIEKVEEAPIKEKPKPEMPKVETPKKPFVPKMPKPVIPEIDINNYYMMNMANVNVEQKPHQAPQLPPKPTNILPEAEPAKPFKPVETASTEESSSMEMPIKGGFQQPMNPFKPYPAPGMTAPGGYPYPQAPAMQQPPYYGGMPGVESDFDEESSAFMPNQPAGVMGAYAPAQMPQMPNMPNMPQMAPGMGNMPNMPNMPQMAPEMGNMPNMPNMPQMAPEMSNMPPMPMPQVSPEMANMPPMPNMPQMAPMMQAPYPCPPFQAPYPMPYGPGPGFPQPMPAYPPAFGPGPQVAGAYDMMPYGPNQPMPAVQGAMEEKDCGCGGPQLVGSYGPPHQQAPVGYGMPGGFAPNYPGMAPAGYEGEYPTGYEAEGEYPDAGSFGAGGPAPGAMAPGMPGAYGPGVAAVYSPPYGQPFASPPFMNPYGPMGAGYGMPRPTNESDESDD